MGTQKAAPSVGSVFCEVTRRLWGRVRDSLGRVHGVLCGRAQKNACERVRTRERAKTKRTDLRHSLSRAPAPTRAPRASLHTHPTTMADPPLPPTHTRRPSLGAPLDASTTVLLADYLDASGDSLPADVAPLTHGHVKTEDSGGRPYVGASWGGGLGERKCTAPMCMRAPAPQVPRRWSTGRCRRLPPVATCRAQIDCVHWGGRTGRKRAPPVTLIDGRPRQKPRRTCFPRSHAPPTTQAACPCSPSWRTAPPRWPRRACRFW